MTVRKVNVRQMPQPQLRVQPGLVEYQSIATLFPQPSNPNSQPSTSLFMSTANQIDYIEFQARDLAATRKFFEGLFGWKFTDYGPDYTSFDDGRINGGFARGDTRS